MTDVIVVGGGPAGMMAAGRAAELGASVLLVEKNPSLGKKLLISGGGRCNFTNAEPDVRALADHYGDARNALLSPFHKFPSTETLAWFEAQGMPWKVEENHRAFPRD
ncbi:MAG TPA: NAD(P)/FAD-dependent oxidoreductase, partial [Spirochaetia bacterium]|nr:NAD(P)/FAD-dependent oxidoreductase [Spirochaetia bacterium]